MDPIIKSLRSANRADIRSLEKALKKVRSSRNELKRICDSSKLTFIVKLVSMWQDHGEKNVKTRGTGQLQKLIQKSEAKFKKTNNRTDLQAEYSVFVQLRNKDVFSVPKELWEHLREKRTT